MKYFITLLIISFNLPLFGQLSIEGEWEGIYLVNHLVRKRSAHWHFKADGTVIEKLQDFGGEEVSNEMEYYFDDQKVYLENTDQKYILNIDYQTTDSLVLSKNSRNKILLRRVSSPSSFSPKGVKDFDVELYSLSDNSSTYKMQIELIRFSNGDVCASSGYRLLFDDNDTGNIQRIDHFKPFINYTFKNYEYHSLNLEFAAIHYLHFHNINSPTPYGFINDSIPFKMTIITSQSNLITSNQLCKFEIVGAKDSRGNPNFGNFSYRVQPKATGFSIQAGLHKLRLNPNGTGSESIYDSESKTYEKRKVLWRFSPFTNYLYLLQEQNEGFNKTSLYHLTKDADNTYILSRHSNF